jgi:predicted permease
MRPEPTWRRYLRFWRSDVERDIDDELEFHFSSRIAELVAGGLSAAEARRQVLDEFGNEETTRMRLREIGHRRERRQTRVRWWDGLRADVRYGARRLLRAPFVSGIAVVSLALGIGANTATFSVVQELLLRPIPVQDPGRLVNLGAPGPKPGSDNFGPAGLTEDLFSLPMFRDLARAETGFSGIAAHQLFYASIAYRDRSLFTDVALVSGSYFPVLGIRPALGRLLGPADDEAVGGPATVVLSHSYWATSLGADSSVVGSSIVINGKSFTVVGVGPPGFEGTTLGVRPGAFVPIAAGVGIDSNLGSAQALEDRRSYQFYLFGRLEPGVTIGQARRRIDPIYRGILADVEAPLQKEMSTATLARFKAKTIAMTDGSRGQSSLRAETRGPLLLLFGITAIVVLTACANVANLLLARGATRAAEMAVRVSLGAARQRLLAQLLTESVLLALLGGGAALLVARGTLALIGALLPRFDVGATVTFGHSLRPSVLLFAAAAAVGTGLLFGLFPALHATRPDLITAIRAATGQPSGARAAVRLRSSLVAAQIALSTALLIGAGLFVTSLRNIGRVNLGLAIDGVAQFALAPGFSGKDMAATDALYRDVEREIAAVPGVRSIAASSGPLLNGSTSGASVRVEGFRREPDTDANTRINEVGPGFFATLGIPLLAGREFRTTDRVGTPKVAIVNQSFAKKLASAPIRSASGWRSTATGWAATSTSRSSDWSPTRATVASRIGSLRSHTRRRSRIRR